MTLPAAWQFPPLQHLQQRLGAYLQDMYTALAAEIRTPSWRQELSVDVGAGLGTVTVAVTVDRLPYYIAATPSWDTTVSIASGRTTAQFVLNFGTVAPGGGGTVDVLIRIPEAGASYS